jgi:hypothetical protein
MEQEGSARKRMIGSRAEVMHGTAHHTSGGLTKKDLKYNKAGRIVSVKKSKTAKKKGTLKKWEKKHGYRWVIRDGKPHKVHSGKHKKGGAADSDSESSSDEE